MAPQTLHSLQMRLGQLRPYLRLRPGSGRLWLDVSLLLLVGAVHNTVLPTLTQGLFPIDLMTPWLVTMLVFETLPRCLFLVVLAALILETHTAAPAGLYLCVYWVTSAAIYFIRGTLSWRHGLPWFLTYLLSECWVIGFETFVLAVNASSPPFNWSYALAQGVRLLVSVGLGLLFCQRFIRDGFSSEED